MINFYNSTTGEHNAKILTSSNIKMNDLLMSKLGMRSREGTCLILGYGDGQMVDYYHNYFEKVIVVDNDKILCKNALLKNINKKNVEVVCSNIEDYDNEANLADIILGNHILEHVVDPVEVVKKISYWLKSSGNAIFSTPNASSLHRRIGVQMNIISSIYDFSENDKRAGHKRVYDLGTLIKDCYDGGLKVIESGGFNIKLVSQKQMANWPPELLRAIFEVSLHCPADICSNIYVVCKK
jgi:SAM-dependent methyltransferase